MKKQKNYPLYKVEKIESIKEMISKALRDAKDKPAFMFKNDKKEIETKTSCLLNRIFTLSNLNWHMAVNNMAFIWV